LWKLTRRFLSIELAKIVQKGRKFIFFAFFIDNIEMKISPTCYVCQLKRIIEEIKLCKLSPEKELEITQQMFDFYANSKEKRSAYLGFSARQRLYQLTHVEDPYNALKRIVNEYSATQIDIFRNYLNKMKNVPKSSANPNELFRKACLGSVLGNVMEFFLLEHDFSVKFVKPLLDLLDEETFAIDDLDETFKLLPSISKILLLTDNAGEIYFDGVLIETIKSLFPNIHVTVAVKPSPIINDAMMADAKAANLEKIADRVMTTGINSIGLFLEQTSLEFKKVWDNADLIIKKGMGHFETSDILSETNPCPILYIFRVKCTTVAEVIGAKHNQNVAKLVN
jgi:damage-control phosphatase, subfamily I